MNPNERQIDTYYLEFKAREMHRRRAGIGAIMARALSYLEFHRNLMGEQIVEIRIAELQKLFDIPRVNISNQKILNLEDLVIASQYQDPVNAHLVNKREELALKHNEFMRYFSTPRFANYNIDQEMNIDKTIGIHLRGTDKSGEMEPVSPYLLYKHIDSRLDSTDIENIFLATDDQKYRMLLFNRYGKTRISYNPNNRVSLNGKPLHLGRNRDEMNQMVIQDIFSLSRVKELLFCYSNVSYLALIAGFNNHSYTGCLQSRLMSIE